MNEALPPQHTKAMQIVADANENIARIRARTDLVPEAKAQRIADVYSAATGRLDPLRAEYEAGETNRLARLQRKAFALPLDDSMAAARYDPGTPYRNAQVAEQRLGNAVLLTLDGWGHPSFQIPSDCIDRARVRYLVKLITPRPGTHCQPDKVPFH